MSTMTKSAIQTASLYSLEKLRDLTATRTPVESLQAADGRAVAVDANSVNRSVAQFDQLERLAYTRAAPSTDSRYVRFVEAMRALRVDLDFSSLSRAQIDRILQSAARMYLVNDGIPEPVEPPPIHPESYLHQPLAEQPDGMPMAGHVDGGAEDDATKAIEAAENSDDGGPDGRADAVAAEDPTGGAASAQSPDDPNGAAARSDAAEDRAAPTDRREDEAAA